jgi:ferredoxin
VRVVVDFSRCDAHGKCVEVCPEVFDLDDDDQLIVLDETPPEALHRKVEDATRQCPKAAIRID